MALAVDSTTATKTGTASAVTTNSHTCSGTNRILFVGITIRNTRTITVAPTYNGVTMTLAKTTAGVTNLTHFLYYLVAPSIGSYTVNFTQSASDTYAVATISYTGANQYTPIDASTSYTGTTTTSFSPSVTTVADNSVAVFWGNGTSGAALTAGALTTVVNQPEVAFAGAFLIRSTAEKTPAGTFTLNVTSSTQTYSGNIVSIKPSATLTFKQATVAAGDVPSTQTNFPSYVDLSRLGITTLAEAQSVRVYADSAKTTEWAREIVSATEMHVKVPSLTSTTSMYVDWDGVRADYAVTDTYGRNAVWSDYAMVHHQSTTNDSTSGGLNVTNTSVSFVSGKVGEGGDYNGTSSTSERSASTPAYANQQTIQAWFKADVFSGTSTRGLIEKAVAGFGGEVEYQMYVDTAASQLQVLYNTDNGGTGIFAGGLLTGTLSLGTWYMFHGVIDRANNNIYNYLNSALALTSSMVSRNVRVSSRNLRWGKKVGNGSTSYWDGIIDEVRIRNSSLSADWITTEYNNQSDEAGFWGTWSDVGGATDTTKFFAMM